MMKTTRVNAMVCFSSMLVFGVRNFAEYESDDMLVVALGYILTNDMGSVQSFL